MGRPFPCAKQMSMIVGMREAHDRHDPLRQLDLNLLRALDALLVERHVTRAAARLSLTQSAASRALARLREELGDPLLVRGPTGALLPTPRAEQLGPVVRRALEELAAAWRGEIFDPATARRRFTLTGADYAELVLLPGLTTRLAELAPHVQLVFVSMPNDLQGALASGAVDVLLAPHGPHASGLYQRQLFDESFVVAMRAGHPAATGKLTVDRFCELSHLLISPRGQPGGAVDDALAALGRRRHVAVMVPHFLVAPHVIAASDLVITMAMRMVAAFAATFELVTRPTPLPVPGFTIHLQWHERTHADPGQRWFREQVAQVAASLKVPRGIRASAQAGALSLSG
jgi:DNA-binding transcriptional LysR family regulator